MKILYLAHDVSDPSITRRVTMLEDGGASVTLAGFRRSDDPMPGTIDLGKTHNGKFLQRILSVIREMVLLRRHQALFQENDLILARSLEMLAIGERGRSFCQSKPILVYECLDIHRLLLRDDLIGKAMRGLEGWLSCKAAALITSSPAFVSEYFERRSNVRLAVRLVENKVYAPAGLARDFTARPPGSPWRIGWFGAIRCRQSLELLCNLAARNTGQIEVIIRGRPSQDQFDDFDAIVARCPYVSFHGPYKNPDDLALIYRDVHFTWAIDRFEAGQNSAWLLPNRLYEGGAYGSVPIAEKAVETGRVLDRLNIGVTLDEPLAKSLADFFAALTPEKYRTLEQASEAVPIEAWVYERKDASDLVSYLQGLKA